jgi:hypothetical protein
MASKIERNKNLQRPNKGQAEKAKRQRTQRKRLIALGMTEPEVNKLNAKQVRTLLKRPLKIKAAAAK